MLQWLGVTVGFRLASSELGDELRASCQRARCPAPEGTPLENLNKDGKINYEKQHQDLVKFSACDDKAVRKKPVIVSSSFCNVLMLSYENTLKTNADEAAENGAESNRKSSTSDDLKLGRNRHDEISVRPYKKSCNTSPVNPLCKKKQKLGVRLIRGSRKNPLRESECIPKGKTAKVRWRGVCLDGSSCIADWTDRN